MFRSGDKVRTLNKTECINDSNLVFQPIAGQLAWYSTMLGDYLPESQVNLEGTVLHVKPSIYSGLGGDIVTIDTSIGILGYDPYFLRAYTNPIQSCECGQQKFNFIGHTKWCPAWEKV